nr:PREDICTED: pre-mRNA 3'-end-processing factor FIP1-like [Equus przewalskii]
MSAGEVERLVSELSGGTGGDEEEEWLYGDENEVERPEEENARLVKFLVGAYCVIHWFLLNCQNYFFIIIGLITTF